MLKILIPTFMLLPTAWLAPAKWLWPVMTAHSLIIAIASQYWLTNMSGSSRWALGTYLALDDVSTPLIILSCWLLPLIIIASQHHVTTEPLGRQRGFLALVVSLQFLLIITFSATELSLFYISFEATLIPTLLLITR